MFKEGARGPGESCAVLLAKEDERIVAPLSREGIGREWSNVGLPVEEYRNVSMAVGEI